MPRNPGATPSSRNTSLYHFSRNMAAVEDKKFPEGEPPDPPVQRGWGTSNVAGVGCLGHLTQGNWRGREGKDDMRWEREGGKGAWEGKTSLPIPTIPGSPTERWQDDELTEWKYLNSSFPFKSKYKKWTHSSCKILQRWNLFNKSEEGGRWSLTAAD